MQRATPLHCAPVLKFQSGSIYSLRTEKTLTPLMMDRNLSSEDQQSIRRKNLRLVQTCTYTTPHSSPRSWEVAFIPFPAKFAPHPTQAETGLATHAQWALPPSMRVLHSRTTALRILGLAEGGNTVSADHLLQMATMLRSHTIPLQCRRL